MIFNKLIKLINEFRNRNETVKLQNAEIIWANVYHDTIRNKEWLKTLAVSPCQWAANYSFLYILVRILSEYKPKKIIEFGLGESSKLISAFLENELQNSSHLIIEHDDTWKESFNRRFTLFKNSSFIKLPVELKTVKGFPVKSYIGIEKALTEIFDLYIVDGPFGSPRFSRYDICLLAERLQANDEFIIIIDDCHRIGEMETAKALINQLTAKGIKICHSVYRGNKSQMIIATLNYKFVTTI